MSLAVIMIVACSANLAYGLIGGRMWFRHRFVTRDEFIFPVLVLLQVVFVLVLIGMIGIVQLRST